MEYVISMKLWLHIKMSDFACSNLMNDNQMSSRDVDFFFDYDVFQMSLKTFHQYVSFQQSVQEFWWTLVAKWILHQNICISFEKRES